MEGVRNQARAMTQRWQAFAGTPLGARLLPVYAALLGGALGALVADRLVRSMWVHAIFTGSYQWRYVALILTVVWVLIGVVAAVATIAAEDADAPYREDAPNR